MQLGRVGKSHSTLQLPTSLLASLNLHNHHHDDDGAADVGNDDEDDYVGGNICGSKVNCRVQG